MVPSIKKRKAKRNRINAIPKPMADFNCCMPEVQTKDMQGKSGLVSASCYFGKPRLANYFRRYSVSQSCSGWNDVVPLCYKHRN